MALVEASGSEEVNVMRRVSVVLASVLMTAVGWQPAAAQTPNTVEGLSLADAVGALTTTPVSGTLADAVVVGTQLEVATAPLGTVSGGFTFVVDPDTGAAVQTPRSFGPAFGERVPTSGKDKLTAGIRFIRASYDKIGGSSLDRLEQGSIEGTLNEDTSLTGTSSLVLSSQTMVMFGSIGITDDLDFGVAVPMVKVDVDGVSFIENGWFDEAGAPEVVRLVTASGRSSGVGDVRLTAKYRLTTFGEEDALHDPGGFGVLVRASLPTGDPENLRGLGVNRILASFLVSGISGPLGYHANAGYEWWSGDVPFSPVGGGPRENLRGMVEYVGGVEVAATERATLVFDVLGRHVLGGGGSIETTGVGSFAGSTVRSFGMSASDSLRKIAVAPGLRYSFRGTVLLSLNVLIPVSDNGVHDQVTPVVGFDFIF